MNYLELVESKVIKDVELSEKARIWSNTYKKIVFTNGCFDILHYGHINYLAKAKSLGDFLVIGLNSDSSVKKLKGDSRPLNNQMARAMLLASLVFVDAVVVFEEETPESLIKLIAPDILVKGGDYKVDEIAGADFVLNRGGSVEIIQFVDGFSSTKIINNMGAD